MAAVDADGRRLRRLKPPLVSATYGLAWSRSGAVAYVTKEGLFVLPAEGKRAKRLTKTPVVSGLAWSPDGTTLAYEAVASLRIARAPAYAPRRAGDGALFDGWVGNVRYQGYASGDRYLVSLDGSPRKWIGTVDDTFEWSGDGKTVASAPWSRSTICLRTSGRTERCTTLRGSLIHSLAWSPAGDRLVFATNFVKVGLWTIRRDGSGLQRIFRTTDENVDGRSAWSPDGSLIAFEQYGGSLGVVRVMIVPSSGGKARHVANGRVEGFSPMWVPATHFAPHDPLAGP